MSWKKAVLIGVAAGGLIIAGIVISTVILHQPTYGIPQKVLEQNAFPIFVMTSDNPWQIEPSATTYLEAAGVLSLKFTRQGSPSVTMTQQATPGAFNDIPNYFSIMLNKLHEYQEVSTAIGTVALTRPEELAGSQSAVGNIRGTLFFAHPDKDLSDSEWKTFFSKLKVLR